MALKSIPFAPVKHSQEIGSLVQAEVLRAARNMLFWLAAMALIACPVWIPILIEWLLGR